MKKNLIKGMAVLCASAAFVACSHDSVFDENLVNKEKEQKLEQKMNEYKANFEKKYGPVDPNQSWDFTNYGVSTRAIESEQKQEGNSFYSFCAIDEQAMKDLITGSSSSYNVKVERVDYAVKASARDIDFNPFFQAKLTPCFARIDKFNTTTYHYYHLDFKWGNNQSKEMIANIKVVGRNTGDYWYNAKGSSSIIHHTSRLVNTLDGVGSGNWYAYYTVNTGNGTADHVVPVQKVREFIVNDGKNPVRTYWGFDCDGADNKKVDLICLVRDYKTPDPIIKRYMIEDLGTTDDQDFNDIVVDFEDDQLGNQTATIRAMGGTLDFTLNVAGNPVWTKSVNGLAKGYAVKDMVNTKPEIDFTKVLDQIKISGWNPASNNISITVIYEDKSSKTGTSTYTIPFPKVGQVPMMFATDPIVPWMLERVSFPEWWIKNIEAVEE